MIARCTYLHVLDRHAQEVGHGRQEDVEGLTAEARAEWASFASQTQAEIAEARQQQAVLRDRLRLAAQKVKEMVPSALTSAAKRRKSEGGAVVEGTRTADEDAAALARRTQEPPPEQPPMEVQKEEQEPKDGTNDNQLQFILLPSRIRNSADPKQD